jgi:hypothetical protein
MKTESNVRQKIPNKSGHDGLHPEWNGSDRILPKDLRDTLSIFNDSINNILTQIFKNSIMMLNFIPVRT